MAQSFRSFVVLWWFCCAMLVAPHVTAVRSLSEGSSSAEVEPAPSKEELDEWLNIGAGRLLGATRPKAPRELLHVTMMHLHASKPHSTMFFETSVVALHRLREDSNNSHVYSRAKPTPIYEFELLYAKRVETPDRTNFRPCPAKFLFSAKGTAGPAAGKFNANKDNIDMIFDNEVQLDSWRFELVRMNGIREATSLKTELYKAAEDSIKRYLIPSLPEIADKKELLSDEDMLRWSDGMGPGVQAAPKAIPSLNEIVGRNLLSRDDMLAWSDGMGPDVRVVPKAATQVLQGETYPTMPASVQHKQSFPLREQQEEEWPPLEPFAPL